MKKSILGLAGILLAGNVWASDLKVGDKMPFVEIGKYPFLVQRGVNDQDILKGPVVGFDFTGDNIIDSFQVYLYCGKKIDWTKPFVVYDFEKGLVYIDNDPLDGYIDKIITEEEKGDENIFTDAPSCSKGISV